MFGLKLKQRRNDAPITAQTFANVVSKSTHVTDAAVRDLVEATIALKYTQSNSVCYALNGQVVGVGAGQQSRLHCTRLAGDKTLNWWLRQHPRVLALPFAASVKRAERNNAIDQMLTNVSDADTAEMVRGDWAAAFTKPVQPLTRAEMDDWCARLTDVVLSSDAFFPFRDNIDRAVKVSGSHARQSVQYGVKYIASPGGSTNDDSIIRACNEYDCVLIHTNLRLFHH